MAKILMLLILFLFLVATEASSFEVYHYTQRDGVACFTVDPIAAFRELAKQYYELGKMEEHKQRILKEIRAVCQTSDEEMYAMIREYQFSISR